MAHTIIDNTNCPTAHLDLQGTELALGSKTIAEDSTRTLGIIKAVVPCKLRLGFKLASGGFTAKIKYTANDTPASFASPDDTLVVSGTVGCYGDFTVPADTPFVQIRLDDANDSADSVLDSGFVELKALLPKQAVGQWETNYHSARRGFSAAFTDGNGDYSCALA